MADDILEKAGNATKRIGNVGLSGRVAFTNMTRARLTTR